MEDVQATLHINWRSYSNRHVEEKQDKKKAGTSDLHDHGVGGRRAISLSSLRREDSRIPKKIGGYKEYEILQEGGSEEPHFLGHRSFQPRAE